MSTSYTVGQVADLAGVTVRTLHHYDEIATILADPRPDAAEHLRRQHRMLSERIERLHAMAAAIEKELEATQMGISLSPEEQFEVFGTDKVGGEWADEAEQRWGNTEAYKQSQQRASKYTKQDWVKLKAEADEGLRGLAQMYVADPRFTKLYEDIAPGLAQYLHDAIVANAER